MDNQLSAELQDRLAELQEIFHQQLPGKIDELQTVWQQLNTHWTAEGLSQLHSLCHSLAGSAGTFGAHEISQQARTLEQRLKLLASEAGAPSATTQPPLAQQIEMPSQYAEQWTPKRQPPAAHAIAQEAVAGNTQGKSVYRFSPEALTPHPLS